MTENKHVLIENVSPSVDGGRYAAKAIIGETCVVEADVFRDGHDPLRVKLKWKTSRKDKWSEAPMTDDKNDRWRAEFRLDELGVYEFFIDAASGEDEPEASQVFTVVVDRPLARFGAWYELFVRSQGSVPGRSGTFKDAEARLPDIKAMGFDVVYLAPIHPIGHTARKGRDNAPHAGPDDPGSPWGVGSEKGGHTAIEPAIGTIDDFDKFVKAARALEMEVALDFAPHCSPDHPWVKEHPEWFYRRPDGTIKCAENPPYVYEDVFPLNFDSPAKDALYHALRDVFLFWASRGVKAFRIDNPHTKPVAFWEWVIAEVKRKFPEVIFLGEAFTRPKMMKALSKAGFSQSYTYFIWRTTKRELTEYVTELAAPDMTTFFRPNFFTTTPDVIPEQLQNAGRAVFELRAALAAFLSPAYGIISGYELIENEALPGTVEYARSEKYEIRVRDWNKPGNIKETIKTLNRIRRENSALQRLDNVAFISNPNDNVLAFAKAAPDKSNAVIVVVNLAPDAPQEAMLQIPMDKLGFPWEAGFETNELMSNTPFSFRQSTHVRIENDARPFKIFKVHR